MSAMNSRTVLSLLLAGAAAAGTDAALAQAYPDRLIRIITTPAGSGSDFAARLLSQGMIRSNFAPQVIVDNRGNNAAEIVIKSPADGYTLLCWGSPVWLTRFLLEDVTWDPVRDLAPITQLSTSPNILVVHPSMPVKSVKELIALAKARPGVLNYASPGTNGGAVFLAAELFKSMANVNIVHIPYKGTGPALLGVIGGEADMMFPSAQSATPQVKSGKLRALAVTSARPSALVPGLPTVAEASGLKGYESSGVFGLWAPAGTPPAVIQRLNQEVVRLLNTPDIREKFFAAAAETVGSTPEEFAAFIKHDMAVSGKLIRNAISQNPK
ncbi:MAG: tripartite tricarboxylate transporter substrate-binding protein [Burkholderiales bacterium]